MATDIVDKELKALRNARWEKAFSQEETNRLDNELDQINRKATIVIEHLIQASDVAHTMQHWHIYRKWNERFFMECYQAYKTGRADTDPSINWYQGEIGFFDFYIIPLAKKLKECGVFGVSSAEYLNYATKNRYVLRLIYVVIPAVRTCTRKSIATPNIRLLTRIFAIITKCFPLAFCSCLWALLCADKNGKIGEKKLSTRWLRRLVYFMMKVTKMNRTMIHFLACERTEMGQTNKIIVVCIKLMAQS
jgi:3'5'-cyclic nucleotide phosphodiesterase